MGEQRLIFALVLLAGACRAQKPVFDVVSIKENVSADQGGGMGPRADRFAARNVPLRALLLFAFAPPGGNFLTAQIIGGPPWTDTIRFDVEAIPADPASLRGQPLRDMLLALLEDRFQLKAHRETRDLPVYNLIQTKTGPKPSADQTPPDPSQMIVEFVTAGNPHPPVNRGGIRMVNGPSSTTLIGRAIPVSRLVTLLQGRSDRIVLDKTAYDKLIDVEIEFSPLANGTLETSQAPANSDQPVVPSLFAALQETGLKLESSKAPLEVVIIDSAQKPSKN